jgi:hypothetical protein
MPSPCCADLVAVLFCLSVYFVIFLILSFPFLSFLGYSSTEVEKVLDCTVIIKSVTGSRGNGIVVAPNKLLTALHGCFKNNDIFDIVDRRGISRRGFVKESWYSASRVDIAVIELNEGSTSFDRFMRVHPTPVNLGDDLSVISRRAVDGPDEVTECVEKTAVTAVISNTAIFHSTYYSEAGMSGCGVVATRPGLEIHLLS